MKGERTGIGPRFPRAERIAWKAARVVRPVTLTLALLPLASGVATAASEPHPYAVQLGKLINAYREQHGVKPLVLVAPLSELANEQAARMAREHRLSHEGFEQRFAKAQSPTCVENVGTHNGPPETAFAAWRDSPIHAQNLLDPRITRMGIATSGAYVAFFACR